MSQQNCYAVKNEQAATSRIFNPVRVTTKVTYFTAIPPKYPLRRIYNELFKLQIDNIVVYLLKLSFRGLYSTFVAYN